MSPSGSRHDAPLGETRRKHTTQEDRMTRKVTRALALLVVLALAVAACGGDDGGGPSAEDCEQVDEVRLQLQWVAQSQFAGYFAALDEGLYEARCLDVTILEGAVDIVPQQVLAS